MTAPLTHPTIPEEFAQRPQWVNWREEVRDGKSTKVPVQPNGRLASTTDSTTWSDLPTVQQASDKIGFCLTSDDGLFFIDLDGCVDPGTREIAPWGRQYIGMINSFTEFSPSGTGVHIYGKGKFTGKGHKRFVDARPTVKGKRPAVEFYCVGRYAAVTGDHVPGTPTTLEPRQEVLVHLYMEVFPTTDATAPTDSTMATAPTTSATNTMEDATLIKKAMAATNGPKFGALWGGDWSGYGSQSEADLALSGILLFWTSGDADHADRLFRQSGLMREKWDSQHGAMTYGAMTLAKAAEGKTEFYTPQPAGNGRSSAVPATRAVAPRRVAVPQRRWPQLPPEALAGLPGEFVKRVEPTTEADPAALLTQFNVYVGNVIGRGAHFWVEDSRHGLNNNVLLVGDTSKSRKGTSRDRVQRPLVQVDETWVSERIVHGLSSGEGLIWAVRDEITKREPIREKKEIVDYQDVITDPGVADKRLLVVETEFASALKVASREGNTLSAQVRQAWDSGNLRTMTKNSPAQATGAHISVIAHITEEELHRHLDATEIANGHLNRYQIACVRRSKFLPEGGHLDDAALLPIVDRLSRPWCSRRRWARSGATTRPATSGRRCTRNCPRGSLACWGRSWPAPRRT